MSALLQVIFTCTAAREFTASDLLSRTVGNATMNPDNRTLRAELVARIGPKLTALKIAHKLRRLAETGPHGSLELLGSYNTDRKVWTYTVRDIDAPPVPVQPQPEKPQPTPTPSKKWKASRYERQEVHEIARAVVKTVLGVTDPMRDVSADAREALEHRARTYMGIGVTSPERSPGTQAALPRGAYGDPHSPPREKIPPGHPLHGVGIPQRPTIEPAHLAAIKAQCIAAGRSDIDAQAAAQCDLILRARGKRWAVGMSFNPAEHTEYSSGRASGAMFAQANIEIQGRNPIPLRMDWNPHQDLFGPKK